MPQCQSTEGSCRKIRLRFTCVLPTPLCDAVVSCVYVTVALISTSGLLLYSSVLFTQKHLHASDCNEVHNTRIDLHVRTLHGRSLSYPYSCHMMGLPGLSSNPRIAHCWRRPTSPRVAPRYDMSVTPYQIPLQFPLDSWSDM